MTTPRLAITTGEPAGIGPDITLMAAQAAAEAQLVAVGDQALLEARARQLGLEVRFSPFEPEQSPQPHRPGHLPVLHVPLASAATPGRLDPANAHYVLQTLDAALAGCSGGQFQAMVTAPVQKSVINEAGIAFTGHTEYLAQRTGTARVVMMLATAELRVALATTHLPLSAVPAAITRDSLTQTLRILHNDLVHKFGIASPTIAVLGLNPHAGEGGHLGREEIEIIGPVLDEFRGQGLDLLGPLPADTAFSPALRARAHAYLAMYHDQGLPVLKFAGFGEAVNITLGLPVIRTSVDHGTALDLAGRGTADPGSLQQALALAARLAGR
jgi:4-hydroxythreonine-4-phosphate dehydrogenase